MKTYEVYSVMYVHKTFVLQTYCNDLLEFQLPFWVYKQINMKSILCRRRCVYAGTVNISCLFGCKPKKGVYYLRNERDNGRHKYYKGLCWQNPVSLILK